MCGIVGAVSHRDVVADLVEGLRRLEYRGYDSAGVAILNDGNIQNRRAVGKVEKLADLIKGQPLTGTTGIAHTRWATHGVPVERNAHPHRSGEDVVVVHNGIIENHAELRESLKADGYTFQSETDTEVIAHLLARHLKNGLSLEASVKAAREELVGAYGMAAISPHEPDVMVVARAGSPLVIGIADDEHLIASDIFALLPITQRLSF